MVLTVAFRAKKNISLIFVGEGEGTQQGVPTILLYPIYSHHHPDYINNQAAYISIIKRGGLHGLQH